MIIVQQWVVLVRSLSRKYVVCHEFETGFGNIHKSEKNMSHEKLYKRIKSSLRAIPFEESAKHSRLKDKRGRKPKTILIKNIPYLFSCDETEKLRCYENHSIIIQGDTIKEVLPSKKVKHQKFDNTYDAGMRGGIVVTPGLINAHAHPPMYLMRSAMMLDEGEGVDETIASFPQWEQVMSEEDYSYSSIGDITEQQKGGITTTLSHFSSYHPLEIAARATKQNVINAVSVASSVHPENSPELIERLVKENKNDSSHLAICFHYVYKASPKVLKEVKRLSDKYDLLITCHMAESENVAEQCLRKHRMREVETLEKYHLLTNRTIVSHSIYINDAEIRKLIKNKVGVVHLPTSNVIHKSGTFPLWKFRDFEGSQFLSLGTDGVVSKSRLDLLSEAYQTRVTHLYNRTVKFGSLFKMMTVNGARVLNMPDRGRILPGMKADLAFWKLKDRGFIPFDQKNPMTLLGNLVTHGGRVVRDLMINGQFIVAGRRHQLVNESKLLAELQKRHMALRKRVAGR
ncbi:MAG: amidohydrolase family protein [Parcubacteria group bacterium]|jgi:5-methylthioadenosine/S-adenosylhomocysteine deaminase